MKLDRRDLLAVFTGGAIGALARVGLTQLWPSGDSAFPWAVLVINLSGAALLGYLITDPRDPPAVLRIRHRFMGTGFCGAYTTFSTMQLEMLHMVDAHRYGLACLYVGVSVVGGYIAVYTSVALTRSVQLSS